MSVYEMLRVFHKFDPDKYLSILKDEHGAKPHPSIDDALKVGKTPFYRPQDGGEYIYIVSFNHIPLPEVVLEAVINHPELVPDDVLIFLSAEVDICLETTAGEERGREVYIDPKKRELYRRMSQTFILLA